jgi:putative phage-type endonuclease
MNVELILPRDAAHWHSLRDQCITSTESPALFGLSPYETAFELWHRKREKAGKSIAENERMRWGKRLQDSVAAGLCEDHGWKGSRWDDFALCRDERLGASFDWVLYGDDGGIERVLEIKCVDFIMFRDGWLVEGDEHGIERIEAPVHIELQHQHQLMLAGLDRGVIGVLVAGNQATAIERRADYAVHKAIRAKAAAFWQSIDEGREPAPTFPDDARAVIERMQYAQVGKAITATGEVAELAKLYAEAAAREKAAELDKESAKARILLQIGDAERVAGDGFSISAGLVGPAEIAYTRKPYRNFRVTPKKEKTA